MSKNYESMDYDFKCVTPDDFEITLRFKPKGHLMNFFIRMARTEIKKRTAHAVPSDKLEEAMIAHVLPDGYNNLVRTSCKPVLKHIYEEVEKDGVIVVRDQVSIVKFHKEDGEWNCVVELKGMYHKENQNKSNDLPTINT